MLAAGAPVEPTGARVPRPGPGWARDGRNLTQLRFPDDGRGRPLDGVRGVLRNPQVHASTRQIPSLPAAATPAGTTVPGLLVDVVVLTGDLALFEASRHAVGDRNPSWRAPTAEDAVDLLLAGRCGVLLIDMATVTAQPATLVEQIVQQFPDVVVVVAGRREDEPVLAGLVSDGLVYRFMHKPLSPKRAGMFLAAAIRAHVERREGRAGEQGLPLVRELHSRVDPRKWMFVGAGMLLFLVVLAGVLLTRYGPPQQAGNVAGPVRVVTSAAPLADPVLSRARAALAAGRYESPPGRNALDLFAAVLLTRPDDTEARQGLRATAAKLVETAERAAVDGDVDEARRIAERVLKADPRHAGARSLLATLAMPPAPATRPAAAATERLPPIPLVPPAPVEIDPALLRGPVTKLPDPSQEAPTPAVAPVAPVAMPRVQADPLAPLVVGGALPTSPTQRPRLAARRDDSIPVAPAHATAGLAKPPVPAVAGSAPRVVPVMTQLPRVEQRDLEALATPPPLYPPAAFRQRVEGWVEVEFTVDERGGTRDVTVVAAEPHGTFDAAATAAVSAWSYRPRIVNGQAVAQRTSVTLQFNVED